MCETCGENHNNFRLLIRNLRKLEEANAKKQKPARERKPRPLLVEKERM